MNSRRVPFFVTLGLALALGLGACHGKGTTGLQAPSAGVESKVGKALTKGSLCTDTQTDTDGNVSLVRLTFNSAKPTFTRTRLVLQSDGSLAADTAETGTWAVLNDELYLMHDQVTESSKVTFDSRSSDGASCYKLSSTGSELKLCSCNH